MPKSRVEPVMIEGAKLMFRNFSGKTNEFNPAGKRNFCIKLDPDLAEVMRQAGWNVRTLAEKPEYEQAAQDYIQVKVTFKGRPPTIVLITSRGRTDLPEDLLMMLDYADIANVDLIIRPYEYDFNRRTGISAYLRSIYVTIREDPLQLKYADVPEIEEGQTALETRAAYDYEGEVVEEEYQKALEGR